MDTQNSPIFTQCYSLVAWILARTTSFPRHLRSTLGERLAVNSIELLERITEALFVRSKSTILSHADSHLRRVRILLRLARELGCLTPKQHSFAVKQADEVGRMLGGWMRQQQRR